MNFINSIKTKFLINTLFFDLEPPKYETKYYCVQIGNASVVKSSGFTHETCIMCK